MEEPTDYAKPHAETRTDEGGCLIVAAFFAVVGMIVGFIIGLLAAGVML